MLPGNPQLPEPPHPHHVHPHTPEPPPPGAHFILRDMTAENAAEAAAAAVFESRLGLTRVNFGIVMLLTAGASFATLSWFGKPWPIQNIDDVIGVLLFGWWIALIYTAFGSAILYWPAYFCASSITYIYESSRNGHFDGLTKSEERVTMMAVLAGVLTGGLVWLVAGLA